MVVPTRRWMSRNAPRCVRRPSTPRMRRCPRQCRRRPATSSRASPIWPRTTARNSGTWSGAEPSVISGSVRALWNCSRAAQEIHCASMASAPRVC